MQDPRDAGDVRRDNDERPVLWLYGLLPYHPEWYRPLVALVVAGGLMGAAVRALLPEVRAWPVEQFHLRDRIRRPAVMTPDPLQVEPTRFQPTATAAPAAPLVRLEGARLEFPANGVLPIRVLPTPGAAPTVAPLRQGVTPLPQIPAEVAPALAERAFRRARPGRAVAPLAPAVGGRSISGSSDRGATAGGMQRAPIIGARHEYPNLESQEVVGSQNLPITARGTVRTDTETGGGGGVPPRVRRITAIRLVPELQELPAGMSEDYDLQVELDYQEWFSVTHWPEASFRLITTGMGVEQHRQADNVFSCLLGASPVLDGSRVTIEGILQLPGGRPLIARAVVVVRSETGVNR